MTPMNCIENRTYDEIKVGDTATLARTLKPQDIQLFAIMSGDVNPAHVDPEYAKRATSTCSIAPMACRRP